MAYPVYVTGKVNQELPLWSRQWTFSSCDGGYAVITDTLPADSGLRLDFSYYKNSSRVLNGNTVYDYVISIRITGTPLKAGEFHVQFYYVRTGYTTSNGRQVLVSESPRYTQFYVQIDTPPCLITTKSLPDCVVATPYSALLEAIGTATPITWSITDGSLPPGLSLDPNTGVISGTPILTA